MEGGRSEAKLFKGKYEAKMEFPEGMGSHRITPFRVGGGGQGGDGYSQHRPK